MDFDVERFISEMEKRPALWDKESDKYNNRIHKIRQWEEVINIFSEPGLSEDEKQKVGETLQKRWRNFRDCFMREYRRISNLKKESNVVTPKISFKYYNRLIFLEPYAAKNKTQNSVQEINENDDQVRNPDDRSTPPPPKRSRKEDIMEDMGLELISALKSTIEQKTAQEDPDRQFLLSLLHDFKRVPPEMKPLVKINILKCIMEAGDQSYQTFYIKGETTDSLADHS